MLYNDRAVLENHHVSAAYRLLQDDDEMNILSNLSKDDWRSEETSAFFAFFTGYKTTQLKNHNDSSVRQSRSTNATNQTNKMSSLSCTEVL